MFLTLRSFDPPPPALQFNSGYYTQALKSRTQTQLRIAHIKESRELRSSNYSQDDRHAFLSSLVAAADGRPPASQGDSLNEAWLAKAWDANILTRLVPRPTPLQVRTTSPAPAAQLMSRLHCLAASASTPSHRARTNAREIVYEASNFDLHSAHGPFVKMHKGHKGGLQVDWRKMEALASVMAANLNEEGEEWGQGEKRPAGWSSTRSDVPAAGSTNERDWAGIESGLWRGTYAFLDFRSFDHFNNHRGLGGDSPDGIPSLANEMEAVGDVMALQLKIVDLPAHHDPAYDLFDPDTHWDDASDVSDAGDRDFVGDAAPAVTSGDAHSTLPANSAATASSGEAMAAPPLHFHGTTAPLRFHGTLPRGATHMLPDRTIRGTVSKTADGHVHWVSPCVLSPATVRPAY